MHNRLKRVFRGFIHTTGRGIIRAPLMKYDRHGRLHDVIPVRHSNGLHRVHALHPLHRHRRPAIHGGELLSVGFPNPNMSSNSSLHGGKTQIRRVPNRAEINRRIPGLLNSMLAR